MLGEDGSEDGSLEPTGTGAVAGSGPVDDGSWYPEVPDDWVGKEVATGVLHEWVTEAYSTVRRPELSLPVPASLPPFLGGSPKRPRLIEVKDEWWDKIGYSAMLFAWMVVVTREPTVARIFGRAHGTLSESWDTAAMLREEALDFLEVLLGESWPELDEAKFASAADRLWECLHQEQVLYEGGCIVYNFRGEGEEVDLGEGIALRRAKRDWAESRFWRSEHLQDGAWALTFAYRLPRSPFPDDTFVTRSSLQPGTSTSKSA
jgi:hypothetical protein